MRHINNSHHARYADANMTLATISAPTGHATQLVVAEQLRHSHQIDLSCGYDY